MGFQSLSVWRLLAFLSIVCLVYAQEQASQLSSKSVGELGLDAIETELQVKSRGFFLHKLLQSVTFQVEDSESNKFSRNVT